MATLAGGLACLTGCGAREPQVPTEQANRVASAIAGISAACGESYQQRALEPQPDETGVLESAATMRVTELARVYRMGPEWIYNGETLRQIVALSVRDLRECHLEDAATSLVRQTR